MKTTKTYEKAIKNKYLGDEKSGKLRGDLYALTRSSIRNICISLVDGTLSVEDENIMRNYFKVTGDRDLRSCINTYDIEGFRPICNFFKGEIKHIQSYDALELIALMVDYYPRPYNKYRIEEEVLKLEDDTPLQNNEVRQNIVYAPDVNNGKSIITLKPKNKELFAWIGTASAANELILFKALIALISAGTLTI